MSRPIHRRDFVKGGLAALTMASASPAILAGPRREKLNLAVFGCGGRGEGNLNGVSGENVIGLCDADERMAANARSRFPEAVFNADYRALLDELGDRLDAVVVSTPDHMHAPISLAAMRRGLHCYCEKPLTWSVGEARAMAEVAAEKKLVTQMGNQGTSHSGFRAGVEALRAGILGDVTEVHVWTNRPVWPQALERPAETPEVPEGLHWDLWLGAASERPYHPAYLPFKWRGWYDFGSGALGDMACHTMNLPYMGLALDAPTRVTAETTGLFEETFPAGAKITYSFPARGDRLPVTLTWYEGQTRPADDILGGEEVPGSGCLIIGDRGTLFSPDDYGGRQVLKSSAGGELERPEPSLPRSPGHHAEWLAACRGEGETLSHFGHAGPFAETVLLGNLALRLDRPVDWEPTRMRARNCPQAHPLIHRDHREGFGC